VYAMTCECVYVGVWVVCGCLLVRCGFECELDCSYLLAVVLCMA